MIRRYLPALLSTALFIAIGIALGLVWIMATGRRDVPWWLAVLLACAAAWIADLAEQTIRGIQHRRDAAHQTRTRPGPTRKAA